MWKPVRLLSLTAILAVWACLDATEPPFLATITVTPAFAALDSLGETVQLEAQAFDADGSEMTGKTFIWESSDPEASTVDQSGLVTAIGIGRVTIDASCEGVVGSATVTAGPLGFVFVEQEPYSGDCYNRPSGSVCLGFEDGYTWLIYDAVAGWEANHGYWDGHRVVSAIGFRAKYYHVLETNLVLEGPLSP